MVVYMSDVGELADDRFSAHQSVAGNALAKAGKMLQKQRKLAFANGANMSDVVVDDIANYVQDMEAKGLDLMESSLCTWATGGASRFCKFIVMTKEMQWVNNIVINLPIVAQVTHQIATKAAGAVEHVAHTVWFFIQKVADAVNKFADVVSAATEAATNIVHSVLNFFGFADRILSRSIAEVVGSRFRDGTLKVENALV